MAAQGSSKVVLAALGFNLAIAVSKFVAFVFTSSSAMLSEAIHSLIDTSNQVLLIHGFRRAARPADAQHPFGYGKELYFWSFVVAIVLFSMGAGVAIYEGVAKLLNPHPLENVLVSYVVLAVAALLEGGSTIVALRSFNAERKGRPVIEALRRSKDPALFTVLLEDAAALAGLLVAFLGIAATHLLGFEQGDGLASIAIGIILAAVAAFISVEVKSLLIGEAASPELQREARRLLDAASGSGGRIAVINEIRTMQLGPNDVLVTASVDVGDDVTAGEIKADNAAFERALTAAFPEVRKLYLEIEARERPAAATPDVAIAGQPSPAAEPAAAVRPPGPVQPSKPSIQARPPTAKKGRKRRR